MSEEIKFTQEEMQEIADLQSNYQQKIFQLGQIRLDEISIEDAKKNLETRQEEVMTEWKEIQKTGTISTSGEWFKSIEFVKNNVPKPGSLGDPEPEFPEN